MALRIDTSTEFGARVVRRLQDERVIWLTTVRRDGTPEPNPVWFIWDGATLLIYGKRSSRKLEHIAHHARVSLNFNTDEHGGNVVVFTGTTRIEPTALPADQNPSYLAKYRPAIAQLGLTPETFAREYCAPIRATPTHLGGF